MAVRTPATIRIEFIHRVEESVHIICVILERNTAATAAWRSFYPYLSMARGARRRTSIPIAFEGVTVALRTPIRIRCGFTSGMQKARDVVRVINRQRIITATAAWWRQFSP